MPASAVIGSIIFIYSRLQISLCNLFEQSFFTHSTQYTFRSNTSPVHLQRMHFITSSLFVFSALAFKIIKHIIKTISFTILLEAKAIDLDSLAMRQKAQHQY
jgi:hypothetical protein